MVIDKLPINDLLIVNVTGASPPEDTRNNEPIDPQQPDLTCTPDPTKTKPYKQAVGAQNGGRKEYGKATALYNKYQKNSEQWNQWHPVRAVHNFQQTQLFSQQTETWRDQHYRHGLNNFKIEYFQSADAVQKHLSELDFGLGDDCWIEDDLYILRTLCYRDIFQCIQFLLAHRPGHVHLDLELVCLVDSDGRRICSETNSGDRWCDTRDQLFARATIVPVICASAKTHLTNLSGNEYTWLLYLTIVSI
jgi:hypothetical protein